MKNILVVGGGIVGITASYFAKQPNNKVTLIESANELGGLLKSDCNKYGSFDYGTHVAAKTGILDLDDFLFSDFDNDNCYKFNVGKGGNFFAGKLSDISPYVNTNHLPKKVYEKGCVELLKSQNKVGNNLKETLTNRYGSIFYSHIFKDLVYKNFGCDAEELANECLNYFDMNRLLVFDKEMTILKKEDEIMDEKIGFHTFTVGVDKFYPKKGGIGQWIKYLERKLIDEQIEIKTQTEITKFEVESDKFIVTLGNGIIEVDELIWTLSSGLLNKFIPSGIVGDKPNYRKTAVYDFVFDKPLRTSSLYINNYDKNYLSNRITFYQNLQKQQNFYACSVEVLRENNFIFENSVDDVEQELFKMGLIEKDRKSLFSQCRMLKEGFPSLTNENVKSLQRLNSYYKKEFRNITLLGRNSAKGFFMSELLKSAYQEVKK